MSFSHADILFLTGFALGCWLWLFFGPAVFAAASRFFRKRVPAAHISVRIGLDAAAFLQGVRTAQSAIANLKSQIP